MSKIFYLVEPMMGIGPNVDAQFIIDTVSKKFTDVELVVAIDDQIELRVNDSRTVWYKLAPWRYDSLNAVIRDSNGNIINDSYKIDRANDLIKLFEDEKPDALLLHNYLSGSKWDEIMDFEAMPLINHVRKNYPEIPIFSFIIGMIDSFENISEQEEIRFVAEVNKNIDYILLRSDNLELFLQTCEQAEKLKNKIYPVGYTASTNEPKILKDFENIKEIIVSAGGGDLGHDLYEKSCLAFIEARKQNSILSKYNWRIFVGPMQNHLINKLNQLSQKINSDTNFSNKIFVQSHVSADDFLSHLKFHSILSISQCGQRTFCDLEVAGVPSLVVPRESNGKEYEQLYRGKYLEKMKRSVLLRESDLTAKNIVLNSEKALKLAIMKLGLDLNGPYNLIDFIYNKIK